MTDNIPSIPIPKTYHRFDMKPQERIESFAAQAKALLDRLDAGESRIDIVCLSLSAAYVEGVQDGQLHGYEPPSES